MVDLFIAAGHLFVLPFKQFPKVGILGLKLLNCLSVTRADILFIVSDTPMPLFLLGFQLARLYPAKDCPFTHLIVMGGLLCVHRVGHVELYDGHRGKVSTNAFGYLSDVRVDRREGRRDAGRKKHVDNL